MMATAAHTPGLWAADGEVRSVGNPVHMLWCGSVAADAVGYRGTIADVQSADHIGGISCDEAAANACLIAAAPDMLALLRELIDIEGPQPGTSEWASKVHAAIAKATSFAVPA